MSSNMEVLKLYWWMINVAALILYLSDKLRAKQGRWRIPEATLLFSAVLGGSAGALFGMLLFRHKTQHRRFAILVPLLLLLQMGLDLYLRRPDWLANLIR